jgi:hypothetical protein
MAAITGAKSKDVRPVFSSHLEQLRYNDRPDELIPKEFKAEY